MEAISKTDFKAHALEVLRDIEKNGVPRVITNRGRPTIENKKTATAAKKSIGIAKRNRD